MVWLHELGTCDVDEVMDEVARPRLCFKDQYKEPKDKEAWDFIIAPQYYSPAQPLAQPTLPPQLEAWNRQPSLSRSSA